jgi:hexosaminidase
MAMDDLLPQPVSVRPAEGEFILDEHTTIGHDAATATVVTRFATDLRAATALPLSIADNAAIRFHTTGDAEPEGYRITITPTGIEMAVADLAGAEYATQTLRQLLGPDAFRRSNIHSGPWTVPCGTIADHPRLAWRGCLLDVARHFRPKADVLRFVDLLAAHKLNVLHLHLTDDQGWRFEVPKYPKLTEISSWRTGSTIGHPSGGLRDHRPHGGYYTTADLREIVGYAADRGITVVPEVDVPGHAQAVLAAYPGLGNTGARLDVWTSWGINENVLNADDATVAFFRDVFDHVLDIFPSPIIGVGGDEVPVVQWERSDAARARAKELGFGDDVHALHGWFIREIAKHLASRGRRALGWDEIAEAGPLPEGCVIASWRGEQAGIDAARAGYDVIMCPETQIYLDHRASDRPDEPIPVGYARTVADVYAYQPVPADLDEAQARHILGAQAQVWTEHLDSVRRVDYATFPRLCAFAEVVWSPDAVREPADFDRRLTEGHLPRLDALGVEYRPMAGPRPWQQRPDAPGRPRTDA